MKARGAEITCSVGQFMLTIVTHTSGTLGRQWMNGAAGLLRGAPRPWLEHKGEAVAPHCRLPHRALNRFFRESLTL